MKILLTAVNAKYIHSNLAVYSLRANAGKYRDYVELAEFSINHRMEDILKGIYRRRPDVLCFSCYIWNISIIKSVAREIRKVLPETKLWLGGPEVSYDIETGLLQEPFIDGIMIGEGEETFRELAGYYVDAWGRHQRKPGDSVGGGGTGMPGNGMGEKEGLSSIRGIAFKNEKGKTIRTPMRPAMDMGDIIFPYGDLSDFANKIIYYETSRGCPYQCSYCLSSIEKTVRLRPLFLVEKELQFFLDQRVSQVKFIDRTFNCHREHSRFIWRYLWEHDNGITNFHFEISADLLEEEDFRILNAMRPGLVQLEIGVQSTNMHTIRAIHRKMDLDKLACAVKRVHSGNNIHQHLDLIAGLPWEDLDSFRRSFNDVYAMRPDQLQLGFLKVLKGAAMEADSEKYHIVYQDSALYEVLKTDWMSYDDLLLLKGIEEMVEVYYNSGQFVYSIAFLEHYFEDAFSMYQSLAEYYDLHGYFDRKHTRLERFEILRAFFEESITSRNQKVFREAFAAEKLVDVFCELLTCDVYLRENSKTRPGFAPNQARDKERFRAFYQREEKERKYLKKYERFHGRQLVTMTHIEHVTVDIEMTAQKGRPVWKEADLLFDYREREPLHYQAKVSVVSENMKEKLQEMKGAIFDLDGTLLDSMGVWNDVDRIFFSRRGMEVPEDFIAAITPLGFQAAAEYTVKRFHLQEKEEDIIKEWYGLARKAYAEQVVLKPFAKEYLDVLKKNKVRLAAATASDVFLFEPCLIHNGILDYFDTIVTVRDVKRGKGFSDIYDLAAQNMELTALECVVFEDILKGVEGAKAGGFLAVGVEDQHSACEKEKIMEISDIYISSWQELLV